MKKQVLALATIFTLSTAGVASNALAAEHTIKKGETLGDISKQYSMTVEDLKNLNDLNSDLIFANDTLNVLGENDFYTIEPGDTLFNIGIEKGASVEQLLRWNNLSSDLIYAGETLAVSEAAGKVRMQAEAEEQEKQAASQQTKPATQPKTSQAQSKQQATSSQQAQAKQPAASQAPATAAKTFTMSATAYTAYCTGCSGVTANGTDLRANPGAKVIAVDPKVIPLGTRVWVEGYGEAIAADTGGAIKGNKIDVFIPTQEGALNWGRKTVTVKILN
jgi:N-acetylmuramoyl-L-alanine amidase